MTFKTILTALTIGLLPISAYAMCSGTSHQAMSCELGTIWDAETETCIKQVSG